MNEKDTAPATPPAPALVYFRKVLINQPLFVNGVRVPFEHVGGSTGVIALDPKRDSAVIGGIEELLKKRIGGVGRLTQAEYEMLKKNPQLRRFARRSMLDEPLRVMPTQQSPFRQPRSADPPGVVGPAPDQGVKAPPAAGVPQADAAPKAEKAPFKPNTQKMQIRQTEEKGE